MVGQGCSIETTQGLAPVWLLKFQALRASCRSRDTQRWGLGVKSQQRRWRGCWSQKNEKEPEEAKKEGNVAEEGKSHGFLILCPLLRQEGLSLSS